MMRNNSAPVSGPPQHPDQVQMHYVWLDAVRLLAMAMVAVHHLATIHNVPFLAVLDLGVFGVSLFCTISGYLAAPKFNSCSIAVALKWFRRRYMRLMPAYWLTLVAVFLANQFVNYKPVTVHLVAAEFLGIQWYTHGFAIIGIHFWFISLILTCYCLTILVRINQCFLCPILLISVAAVFVEPSFAIHIVTYLVGLGIGLTRQPLRRMLMFAVLLALGIFFDPAFLFPASAVVVLTPVRFVTASTSGFLKTLATLSQGTYEFYLVHGPIYLGFAILGSFGILANATVGTGVAIICAVALRQIVNAIESRIRDGRRVVDNRSSNGQKIEDAASFIGPTNEE